MSQTIYIEATSPEHKRTQAMSSSAAQFVQLVAEHVHGDALCRHWTVGLPEVAAEHAQWVEVLQSAATTRGMGEAYNEGVKLAISRLPGRS
jgi:hypothetical protein